MKKTFLTLCGMLCFALTTLAQITPKTTPDDLFGNLMGTDISTFPEFVKEFSYGVVELGMVNIGQNKNLLGVTLEPEVGFAFYKGKLCSVSYEYKNDDVFGTLTNLLGKPRFHHSYNELLGELYSFVWEGNMVKVTYPVFNYGKAGSQYLTIEDLAVVKQAQGK
jgi:hypothetical protein